MRTLVSKLVQKSFNSVDKAVKNQLARWVTMFACVNSKIGTSAVNAASATM